MTVLKVLANFTYLVDFQSLRYSPSNVVAYAEQRVMEIHQIANIANGTLFSLIYKMASKEVARNYDP